MSEYKAVFLHWPQTAGTNISDSGVTVELLLEGICSFIFRFGSSFTSLNSRKYVARNSRLSVQDTQETVFEIMSEEIFDVFDRRAFVYWNEDNPQETLDKIRYLGSNDKAYFERLSHPILKEGNETIRKYFSLSDDVGGGYLKGRIRKMMGLPIWDG